MGENMKTDATCTQSQQSEELLALGLKYCLGNGVEKDLVEAHKWFNISALNGNTAAKAYRSELALEMSAAQIAEAQRQARAYVTVH